ncbi:MAG TPA: hypothetical protein VEL07_00905 [Planctomycetota bacterium]|nr:hypothetical protein [Planctomycetota bacterium]
MGFLVIPTLNKNLDIKAVRVVAEHDVHITVHRDGTADLQLRDGDRVAIHAEAVTHHQDALEALRAAREIVGTELVTTTGPAG